MLGVVAVLVMLLACANVAGLLLARGVTRRREIAIRVAVGATRWRLIRQLMVEAALLAAAGTVVGIGLAYLASVILHKFPLRGTYYHFEFTPDWRFACAAAVLGVSAALVSGILPALASSRINLSGVMRISQGATPRLRVRSLLVIAQIAVSVILLFGAFVFTRNLIHVLRFDPGFDAAHALQFDLTTVDPKIYPVALREKVYRELESSPGVEAVSWAWYMPFNFSYGGYQLRRADAPNGAVFGVTAQGIGPGYLKAMGIRLVAGRELDWNDGRLDGKATGVDQLDLGIRAARLATVLLIAFAALGLILALIGLSGISIYNVVRRTPEIGIRMALGATPGHALRLMMREGLTLIAAGTVSGLAGTFALTRLLRGFLAADISPLDPRAMVAMLATLFVTTVVSIYFPSRRAVRVDPMITLRHE